MYDHFKFCPAAFCLATLHIILLYSKMKGLPEMLKSKSNKFLLNFFEVFEL